MYIEIVGGKPGQPVKSFDKVHAESFDAAVAMVFRNKAMYRRIERISQNSWAVEVSSITNQISRIRVRCIRLKEEAIQP